MADETPFEPRKAKQRGIQIVDKSNTIIGAGSQLSDGTWLVVSSSKDSFSFKTIEEVQAHFIGTGYVKYDAPGHQEDYRDIVRETNESIIAGNYGQQDRIVEGHYFDEVDEYGQPLIEVPKARVVTDPNVDLDKEPPREKSPKGVRVKRLGAY